MSADLGEGAGRPRSWASLDLEAFAHNIRRARELAPAGRLLAVMKADAYGHGATHLAPVAEREGVAMIGVGDSHEALQLRAAGIKAPLLVLGDLVESEIPAIVRDGIIPTVHSEGRLARLEAEGARQGREVKVHLKVDTGMGRLGMLPARLPEIARAARASTHVRVEGVMTHLASHGAEGEQHNRRQVELFARLVERLDADGLRPAEVHFRSSTAMCDHRDLEYPRETMVRAGAILFGFSPGDAERPPAGFRPVLSLHTQIVFLKDVPQGTPIGYDRSTLTRRATRLGVIPFGYHDGMRRSLANRGVALLKGRRVSVLGQISMDYTTLDITHARGARIGDRVTLIGSDGDAQIPVEEVASMAGTNSYDVLCGLGRRVVRTSVSAGEPAR